MKTRVEEAFDREREESKMIYAYPRLVQALRNLALCATDDNGAKVREEYRKTARGLLRELGEFHELGDVREAPSELKMLAAVIAGQMIGASGYRPGMLINDREAAEDALSIAERIILAAAVKS